MVRLLIIFLFWLSLCDLFGQSELSITYDAKDESIGAILKDLEEHYGVRFSYATTSWMSSTLDASFEKESLESVLDYLLSDQEMEYKIVEDNVLVRKSAEFAEKKDKRYNSVLHLKGKVVTEFGGNKLEYATISISESNIGTYTNTSGMFDIEVPPHLINSKIVVSYIGYEPIEYKLSEFSDNYLLIEMSESNYAVEEIMIVNSEKPIRIAGEQSALTLNSIQIKSSTSSIISGDVSRTIQLLPGVTAHDDDSAEIKIRGSNGDETLMILDGMPIYNTNHYFGIFSGVNSAYIDSVNIFKNTYPIQYTGKTAGLVDMNSDDQLDGFQTDINLNLLTVTINSEIPISSNSSVSLAGRTTIRDISNNQFNTISTLEDEDFFVQNFASAIKNKKSNPKFNFYDFNAKYLWLPSPNSKLSLNFFQSADELINNYNYKVRDERENQVDLHINERNDWSTTSSSLLWSQSIKPNLLWKSRAYYTKFYNYEEDLISLGKRLSNQGGGGPPKVNNPNGTDIGTRQSNSLLDLGFDNNVNLHLNSHTLTVGLTVSRKNIDYEIIENKQNNFSDDEEITTLSGYGAFKFNMNDKFSLDAGLKINHHTGIDTTFLSPQVLLNYKANSQLSFKSSFSIYQQVVRQFYYEYRGVPKELWVAAGQNNIPALSSRNFMLGGTLRIGGFLLDVEAYHKQMEGVVEYAVLNPGSAENNPLVASDYQLFAGEGKVVGIDLILSTGYKYYDTYISYTLSRNQERFSSILNNRYYDSESDRRHQLKWVNSYRVGSFEFGFNSIYSSGRPYTDIASIDTEGEITQLEFDRRFKRLPSYIRLDFSTNYKFRIGSLASSIEFSIFNLLNTENVKYIQSINTQLTANDLPINTVIGNESTLLNRTFNLGLNVRF